MGLKTHEDKFAKVLKIASLRSDHQKAWLDTARLTRKSLQPPFPHSFDAARTANSRGHQRHSYFLDFEYETLTEGAHQTPETAGDIVRYQYRSFLPR